VSQPPGIDTTFLQTLLGYNARRAALVIIERFVQGMAEFDLRPVDFSVLSVVHHNPGVTSRQLCATLSILPPNLVGLIKALEQRGLIERRPHPEDGRALGLHTTATGQSVMQRAEARATELESDAARRLSPQEQQQLIELLQRIYL
jgi:DNA-binding MarR family transcriptional regulator